MGFPTSSHQQRHTHGFPVMRSFWNSGHGAHSAPKQPLSCLCPHPTWRLRTLGPGDSGLPSSVGSSPGQRPRHHGRSVPLAPGPRQLPPRGPHSLTSPAWCLAGAQREAGRPPPGASVPGCPHARQGRMWAGAIGAESRKPLAFSNGHPEFEWKNPHLCRGLEGMGGAGGGALAP